MVVGSPVVGSLTTLAERATRARADATRTLATTSRVLSGTDHRRSSTYTMFLSGRVGEASVVALRRRGAVYASAALLERADLLIRLGEQFESATARIAAGFATDLSTLLTLVRAADELFVVHFNHPASGLKISFAHSTPPRPSEAPHVTAAASHAAEKAAGVPLQIVRSGLCPSPPRRQS